MNREGPLLQSLLQRIAETPAPFLAEPRLDGSEIAVLEQPKIKRKAPRSRAASQPAVEEEKTTAKRADPMEQVHVAAVVGDLCRGLLGGIEPEELAAFVGALAPEQNRLSTTLLVCWVLSDPWFSKANLQRAAVLELLIAGSQALAAETPSHKFLSDPERREELARFVLASLDFRPGGETIAQAQDRLTSLSAAERKRVMRAARQGVARARAIREALAKKAAEESADKWTRE